MSFAAFVFQAGDGVSNYAPRRNRTPASASIALHETRHA
jgi:hypothetical protein